ncbi:MAG: hypothetical protein KJ889_06445 [Gammaproteobacteria bacterium]|nr:hypothetical protein [Gammaproteobacteria bacterium]
MATKMGHALRLSGGGSRSKSSPTGAIWLLMLVTLFAAALLGLSLALSFYPATIFLVLIIASLILIVKPVIGVWVVIVGTQVAVGLIDLYMPALHLLGWWLALLSMGVAGIALMKAFISQTRHPANTRDGRALVAWLWAFIAIAVFSSLANWHGVSGFIIGLKGYFQVWGLLLAIAYLTRGELDARRLISFFLLLGLLQLPFVAHQFLVLVPQRSGELFAAHGIVAGDIVAGTYGGEMMGGGRSSTLALLCVLCVTLVIAQWRAGLHSLGRTILAALIFLSPMFFSEAKLFLVLLPVALFVLFRDRILSNPLKAFVGVVALGALLMAIFFAYSLLPGAKSQQTSSVQKMLASNIEYNVGKRGYGNLLLNRTTVYGFWAKEHAHGDMLVPMLIGHGLGATSGGTALNKDSQIFTRYLGYGIGLTGVSSLLWEVGLIGTAATLMLLLSAFRLGGRLADRWLGTSHWPAIKTAQITVSLFAVSLLHSNYFVFDIGFQAILMVILGYLLVMARIEKVHD